MKTIGLIGGMSWESTVPYYKIINEQVGKKLGGLHSARIILYSVEFSELEKFMSAGEWERIAAVLKDAAIKLEQAGADVVLICTNTMHKLYPEVQKALRIPMIHIADAAADEMKRYGYKKAALLGTRYTMTEEFYKSRLTAGGIEVFIPEDKDIEFVNRVIFEELCLGIIDERSRAGFTAVIAKLKEKGAEVVILGCTEIGMLVRQEDSVLPVFDTTVIHAESAARFALETED